MSIIPPAPEDGSATLPILPQTPNRGHPNLQGRHFRITCVLHDGYLDITKDEETGELSFSGYLIGILEAISRPDRGNFTYELLTPSGYGSKCERRLVANMEKNGTDSLDHWDAYSRRNYAAFKCGESDVNDRPLSAYSTDFYWGSYYITPERLMANKFTIPFSPPDRATLGMVGTATHVRNIPDLVERNEKELGYSVCAYANTAYMDTLRVSFPTLDIHGIPYSADYHELFSSRTCDILIGSYPELTQVTLKLKKQNQCIANGKPVGIIGDPLVYGYNYFAFGIRDDLAPTVLTTLNFWLQALMACFPEDPHGFCPSGNGGGSLSELYVDTGGTGQECGYVQYPPPDDRNGLAAGIIVAIVLSPLVLLIALGMLYHTYQLKRQERRMKKRFIQQLARNIDIGPSAHSISAEKLTEAFKHIGGQDGMISKTDLAKWMNDLHLDFLSENDFDRLWEAMDMDGAGVVDPIHFVTFLGECGPQFKEVYHEYTNLPKTERMKLASRRLTNISNMSEDEVQRLERRHNRISRMNVVAGSGFDISLNE